MRVERKSYAPKPAPASLGPAKSRWHCRNPNPCHHRIDLQRGRNWYISVSTSGTENYAPIHCGRSDNLDAMTRVLEAGRPPDNLSCDHGEAHLDMLETVRRHRQRIVDRKSVVEGKRV